MGGLPNPFAGAREGGGSMVDVAKNEAIRMANPDAGPPLPPDLTDEQVQKARAAMVRRALMGQGLGSTFLTGPLGDLSLAPTSPSGLGGA